MQDIHGLTATMKDSPQEGSEDRIACIIHRIQDVTQQKPILMNTIKIFLSRLSVWLWIPTEVKVGDKVAILDDEFTVTDESATFWSGLIPRKGIELRAEGMRSRDDDMENSHILIRIFIILTGQPVTL